MPREAVDLEQNAGPGDVLRETRESLGYSLDQAAEVTRIRRSYLEALENGDLSILPPPTFARGILRSYAQFLGLDPVALQGVIPEPADVEINSPAPIAAVGWQAQGSWAIAGVIVVILVVALLYIQSLGASTIESGAPLLVELPTPTATSVPAATPAPAVSPTATSQAPTATPAPPPPTPPTPALVALPAVVGQTFTAAEATLKGAGFNVLRQDQPGTAGQVLSQEPPAGQSLPRGSTVTLRVGSGPPQVVVPEVVGRPETEARELLRRAGLSVSPWTNYQNMDELPAHLQRPVCVGCVLSTSPPAGTRASAGSTVSIAVRSS